LKTTAHAVRAQIDPATLPDGTYHGVWGAYSVTFNIDGVTYEAATRVGIRTMAAKCQVTIKDGSVEVEVV
jgi:hypothetical protein